MKKHKVVIYKGNLPIKEGPAVSLEEARRTQTFLQEVRDSMTMEGMITEGVWIQWGIRIEDTHG